MGCRWGYLGCSCLFVFAGVTYSNLEVNHLLGESRHLIVEAERVFTVALGSEDVVTLSFLRTVQDDLAAWCSHGVVNIEGATRLNLFQKNVRYHQLESTIGIINWKSLCG